MLWGNMTHIVTAKWEIGKKIFEGILSEGLQRIVQFK